MKLVYSFLLLILSINALSQDLYVVSKSKVEFTSDAPLELIKANSNQLTGLIKISDRSFAFRIPMKSFDGFNSALQKTHFNENYLESAKYPYTIFEGKIIEEINFKETGEFTVRGKGRFICHGVEQERIIRCKITNSSGIIKIAAEFTVLLDDHNINIPSVVSQKIAEEIKVNIEIELVIKK